MTTNVTSSVSDEATTVSDDAAGFASDTHSVDKKKKDKAPVFCFKVLIIFFAQTSGILLSWKAPLIRYLANTGASIY